MFEMNLSHFPKKFLTDDTCMCTKVTQKPAIHNTKHNQPQLQCLRCAADQIPILSWLNCFFLPFTIEHLAYALKQTSPLFSPAIALRSWWGYIQAKTYLNWLFISMNHKFQEFEGNRCTFHGNKWATYEIGVQHQHFQKNAIRRKINRATDH